jgi:hypothetical protein
MLKVSGKPVYTESIPSEPSEVFSSFQSKEQIEHEPTF